MKYIYNFIGFIDSLVEYFSAPVYKILILLLYVTYIIAIVGITYINPEYTNYLSIFTQIFIAFVLMVRFNPLRTKLKCNENDRSLIFASAFYLLFNDEFTRYVIDYMKTNKFTSYMINKIQL